MFILYPFGYKYSANDSNYNLSGIKMPFVITLLLIYLVKGVSVYVI